VLIPQNFGFDSPQAGVVTEVLFELFQVVFQLRQQAGLTKKAPNSAQVSNGKQYFFSTLMYDQTYY